MYRNSRFLTKFTQRDAEFLNYKQSTIAAACFILAMNTTYDEEHPHSDEQAQELDSNDTACYDLAAYLSQLDNSMKDKNLIENNFLDIVTK